MKKTNMKNFAGLTYVTVSNIPLRETDLGDVINMPSGALERLVAGALLEYKIPICGAEFRVIKSALGLSNEAIAKELGISRNTVLKWGQEIEKRLPPPYEMLLRLLASEALGVSLPPTIAGLKTSNRTKKINITAA